MAGAGAIGTESPFSGNGEEMSRAFRVRFDIRSNRNPILRRRWRFAVSLVCALITAPANAADDFLIVTIGSDETIRQVADRYLSDPDLWPEILKTSGIDSIADLKPGMELRVPVNEITSANKAILEALGQIQKANLAGAQIFAPEEIGRAVGLHEQALQKRLEREWIETRDLAIASYAEATTAIEKSEAQRDQSAEALVSDRKGAVEGQRPEDLSWRGLQLRSILIEEEKVRTLSDSTAQVTFRDASRLRLNSNSNAIIKEMHFDPLSRSEEAKVSLIEGDFYALLSGGDDRKKFSVEIPDVNAVIDSGNFWVSNDDEGAKFTNYDDKTVAVAANGETVTLGKNQGTVVDVGHTPHEKIDVLPPPAQLGPADEGVVYVETPELTWAPVDDSAGYWLEVAGDQNFDRIVENGFGIEGVVHKMAQLPVGEYFWRVSALDGFGLPGERSATWRFRVTPDATAPYLKIDAPGDGVIFREASVEVTGETEPDSTVTVNGAPATLDAAGRFTVTVRPTSGDNLATIIATDPAGNAATAERRFAYMPDEEKAIVFDDSLRQIAPNHFITNGDVLSLNGRTTENAEIAVRSGDTVLASAVADPTGVFRVNVPLTAAEQSFAIAVTAPSGFSTTEDITVTVDREAPEIALETFPPRLTSAPEVLLAGSTEADASVTLNGQIVTLTDGRFEQTVTLKPGDNLIELISTDAAGNVRIDKSTVKLDQEPPRLVSAAGQAGTSGGEPVLMVEVVAEDASGLAKAAPFVVAVGDRTFPGFLRYNKAAKTYQGSLVIRDANVADARLTQVVLQDDAGNSQTFDIK